MEQIVTRKTENGFTLVELAIVLMIIGLLIAGVLRGQEMVKNGRITSTIQQVKSYEGAAITFRDAYGGLPGDIIMASARVPGCQTGNTNYCTNGNGDNIIATIDNMWNNQYGNAVPAVETTQFWKQLALTHLITGVQPNANPATPVRGQTHPAAKLRGGFIVVSLSGSQMSGNFFQSGVYARMQMPASGASPFAGGGCPSEGTCAPTEAASPKEAWQIDRKMDDGRPDYGTVLSDDQGSGASGCEGTYTPANDTALCIMYFKII